jgi:hypothetical protein
LHCIVKEQLVRAARSHRFDRHCCRCCWKKPLQALEKMSVGQRIFWGLLAGVAYVLAIALACFIVVALLGLVSAALTSGAIGLLI